MLSRVADSIYWMSRYIERAENIARYVEVTFSVMLDLPPDTANQWLPLVKTTGDEDLFEKKYGEASCENVLQFLTFDADYWNSILYCLAAARENARSIREAIPSLVWEQLNQFYQNVRTASKNEQQVIQSPMEFFQEVKLASHVFKGTLDAAMSHDEGWHFAQLGRFLERADKTTRMIDVQYYRLLPNIYDVGTPTDDLQWSALLQSVSGFEMYRRRFHQITPQRVMNFLLLDRLFPRAVLHCVESADNSLHAITGSSFNTFANSAEQELGKLRGELAYMHIEEVIGTGMHEFIDSLQAKMNKVTKSIFDSFIAIDADESFSSPMSQSQSMS
jgi:uncharacterized alpha-E superfamily protein